MYPKIRATIITKPENKGFWNFSIHCSDFEADSSRFLKTSAVVLSSST
jgi:hypothetical protein